MNNKKIQYNFRYVIIGLLILILTLIIVNLFLSGKSSNNQNSQNQAEPSDNISTVINDLSNNIVKESPTFYKIRGNDLIINKDGTISYLIYDYIPTVDDIKKIAEYFKVDPSKIKVEKDEYLDRSILLTNPDQNVPNDIDSH